MDFIKKHYMWIIITLICLNLITCGKSCSNSRKLSESELKVSDREKTITDLTNKNKELQHRIDLVNEKQYGLEKSLQIQQDAMSQISNAKKNLRIVVKK